MFQSRGGAVFFVGATLFGAAMLVGTENEDGTLAVATAQIEQQRADFIAEAEALNSPQQPEARASGQQESEPLPADTEFSSPEDLIVDPTGFDPTPVIDDPAAGEVVIVESTAEVTVE